MINILVVNTSVRAKRASDEIIKFVETVAGAYKNINLKVADLRDINLPFFNAPVSPADDSFEITDQSVADWRDLVVEADAVIMLTPEYNHGMAASHKNALDWLYHEWSSKPVAAIGYGWSGATESLSHLNDIMTKLKADIKISQAAKLYFKKMIDTDGKILDEPAVKSEIEKAIQSVVASLS